MTDVLKAGSSTFVVREHEVASAPIVVESWVPEELSETGPFEFVSLVQPVLQVVVVEHSVVDPADLPIDVESTHVDTEATVDLRDGVASVQASTRPSSNRRLSFLSDDLWHALDRELSIRQVLRLGRDLDVDDVLRIRALHRGVDLRPELRWDGPGSFVADHLLDLSAARRELARAESTRTATEALRERVRLAGIKLELTLISYLATELVDPQILDSYLALDVLCHGDSEVSREVLMRIGLARALMEEGDFLDQTKACRHAAWSLILEGWQREAAGAGHIAAEWAESTVHNARLSALGASSGNPTTSAWA